MEKPAADDMVWMCVSKARLSDDERKSLLGDEEEPREHVRGRVVGSAKANERRVRVRDGLELVIHTDHMVPANPDIQDGVDDVAQLSHLNEPSLLHHIASRYLDKELIYTRAGPVLVAMNPFMRLPDLYADSQLATYQKSTAISAGADSDGPRDEAAPPPHVYEVAGVVYNSLRLRGASQSVVINGESGSGKTETTKIILRFLTHQSGGDEISRKLHRTPRIHAGTLWRPADQPASRLPPTTHPAVPNYRAGSNPVLESFGNCVTQRNHNSSRFGKFVRLHYSSAGILSGGSVHRYLLEKSRVVSQEESERSYHALYQLCAGVNRRRESFTPPILPILPRAIAGNPTLADAP